MRSGQSGRAAGPDHAAIAAALRRAGLRDVDDSPRRRAEYSTDGSLYRVVPAVVAFPRAPDEVAAALEACRGLGIPLTMRGAGTSIAGNAIGAGVVLDCSRHLNAIAGIDPEAATAQVQPGVVLDDLQRAAASHGLRFGPEPATHNRCTIGGMIGNNACGSRALGYGRTADNVAGLDILAGTGERLAVVAGADPARLAASPLLRTLHEVAARNLAVLRTEFGRFTRQVSGYSLEHLLPERNFAVPAALTGTEGTCCLVLGATLRLVPVRPAAVLVVLGYPDMASAADAVPALLAERLPGLIALEGLDDRITAVVRARRGPAAVPGLPRGGGWLLAELAGNDQRELLAGARRLTAAAGALGALDSRVVTGRAEAAALWRIREDGAGLASQADPGRPAHAGWEDAAVPPQRLGAYLREFGELLAGHGLHGIPYGHFGDGCVHIRIDFALRGAGAAQRYREFILAAARLVAGYGGSMSGEHGDGRARGELLPLMYSPAALRAMAEVKAACDPSGLLNPGIIQNAVPVDAGLRLPAAGVLARRPGLAYSRDRGDPTAAVHRCIGIGRCIVPAGADDPPQAPAQPSAGLALPGSGPVMCPSFQATRDEKDSTRGRARVLQELANGSLISSWRSAEVAQSLDYCLMCKGCLTDCPAGVDMASYKAEALYQAYRRRLRPAAHYSLGWLPWWVRLAAGLPGGPRLAGHAVGMLDLPLLGPLGRRLAGLDPERELPRPAQRPLRRRLAGRARPADPAAGPAARAGRAVLWADTFTEHFSPEAGEAAAALLEDAGLAVSLATGGAFCCALTWISTGQLGTARRILGRTVRGLADLAAGGATIIGLEPSCTAVLRHDALELLGETPEAIAVARATSTLAEFLSARPGWRPPDLSGVTVLAQPHCHQHAVLGWSADARLLASAGARVTAVSGCCGLAGNFGAERGHYRLSAAVAGIALLPAIGSAAPGTVLLADGFSCRTQIAQLTGRRAVHLAELLAGVR